MVGTGRFELPTPRTPSECSTRLSVNISRTNTYMIRLRFLPLAEEVMQANFEKFIQERKYLTNVTEATIQWYTHAFKWLNTDAPTQDDLKAAVMRMRVKGLK